jgi:hypothetical protein
VEGSSAPDTDIHQRVSGLPLGEGPFATLFVSHLQRALVRESEA